MCCGEVSEIILILGISAPDLQRSGGLSIVCAPLRTRRTGDPLSGRLPNRTPSREIGGNFACAQLRSGRPDASRSAATKSPDAMTQTGETNPLSGRLPNRTPALRQMDGKQAGTSLPRRCVVTGLTPDGQPPQRRRTRRSGRETPLCRVACRIEHPPFVRWMGNRRELRLCAVVW